MADTGWLSAGTYSATFDAGNSPTVDVTNPGNAGTDNGLNATWPFTGASQVGYGLRASNFDFSGIPANAIIDGIEVRLGDYKSSLGSTGCAWDEVRLIGTAGTMIGVDKSAGLPSINFIETAIAGAPDDLWGAWPILRSDLDDIDFGCVVSCVSGASNPGDVDIDFLQIKVYYHVGLPAQVYPAAQCAGHFPPMKTSGGKFYGLAANGGNIRVYSATDPTATWTFEANQTTSSLGGIVGSCLTCRMDSSNVIHIAWIENGGQSLKYVQFSTSTDTFGTVETVETLTSSPAYSWCSMALRSDGDVILAYSGQTDKVMGGDKERVDYARREGGTWTAGLALDAAGDIHYGNPNCVLSANGNDDTHVVWQVTTNTANDPPTAWQNLEARTIDSANNLSTALTGQTGDTNSHLLGHNNLVSFTFSSLNRIAGGGVDSISDARIGIHGFEDGNGDLTSLSSIATTSGYAGFANGEVGIASTARDPGTGGIYRVFSGGTTGNDADQDIHLEDDTDASPIGNNYSNQQELQDAVTCDFISAEVYTRGSATVVAYLYDDNGFQKYNEYQLAGPLGASGSPNVTGPTASGVANHEKDADGTPIVTGPTASGTATLKKAASGTPTVTGPTASGAAKLKKIASGAATLVAVTAVGAAALVGGALTASGSPNITGPTASGQAGMLRQARGGGGTPTVVTRDYQAFPTAANSHSVSITGYTQGNLGIIAIVTNNDLGGGSSFTVPTGWTAIDNAPVSGANQGLRAIFVKVLGASEADPVVCAINPAANQEAEAVFIEVSDWEGTLSGVEVANRDFSTSNLASTETPPPLTVSWGAENNLWIIGVLVMDDPSTVTGWPAGYTTNGSFENNGAGQDVSALVGTSYRAAAVATETPGQVTLSESESVHGFTIGVRPAAATQVPTVTASGAATLGALTASGNPDVSGPTASGQAGKLLTAANVGTFSYVGGGDDQGTTDTAQATHGQTIQSGDLVVAYLNVNDRTGAITAGQSGWNLGSDFAPGPGPEESCRTQMVWRVAGVSEPATYTWSLGTSKEWGTCIKVFRPSGGTPAVDASATTDYGQGSDANIDCGAANGVTVARNAVSIIAGGKDNRSGIGSYSSATQSYTGVLGNPGASQATGMAHRIYTAQTTIAGLVVISTDGISDLSFSTHMSWLAGGDVQVPTTTASGVATKSGALTASGSPNVTGPTASGAASKIIAASGTPNVTGPTASGAAALTGSLTASGSPNVTGPTASGAATLTALEASGSPNVAGPTASGAASLKKAASGTPTVTGPTASGSAGMLRSASGSPNVTGPTASGTVAKIIRASGTPDVTGPTAFGLASLGGLQALGSPDVTGPTASGTVTKIIRASGTPTVEAVTAAGQAGMLRQASGSPSVEQVTASGAAAKTITASGTPNVTGPTASGQAGMLRQASGSPSVAQVTASGAAVLAGALQASGSPNVEQVTASGTVTLAALQAAGSPTVTEATASGTASLKKVASGTPTLDQVTASGAATLTALEASGSPNLDPVTAFGLATLGGLQALGSPNVEQVTASGTVTKKIAASGSPVVSQVTASGAAATITTVKQGSGSPVVQVATAAGSASLRKVASGTPTIDPVTASGTAGLRKQASGSPILEATAASGSATTTASDRRGIYSALGQFPTGSSVTITLYDPVTLAPVSLTNNVCEEIGTTGCYVWHSGKLTTQPVGYKEYVWVMTDTLTETCDIIRVNVMGVDDLFNYVVENDETFAMQLRLIRANAAGRIIEQSDGSYVIRDAVDSKDRIVGDDAVNGGRDILNTDGT